MARIKECVFCPETANLTGEHLWSAWIGKALGPKRYTFTRKERDGNVRRWRGDELNAKAKVVCRNCNSGWMSNLEAANKSFLNEMVLHCSPTVLHSDQVKLLAALAFKNTMIADYMHDNRGPFFTLMERRRFAARLLIPHGVQMWLASTANQHGLFKSGYAATPSGTSKGFEFNHFTYGAGHVVIQVVVTRWTKKAHRRNIPPPVLTQSPAWDTVSIPFWPDKGTPISWPPLQHLGDAIIDAFVERWTHLVRGVGF